MSITVNNCQLILEYFVIDSKKKAKLESNNKSRIWIPDTFVTARFLFGHQQLTFLWWYIPKATYTKYKHKNEYNLWFKKIAEENSGGKIMFKSKNIF